MSTPTDPVEPLRVVLATIGVGVPLDDVAEFAAAVAEQAAELGYWNVAIDLTGGTVSGVRDDLIGTITQETCPACLRQVARYPTGNFYRHHCRRPA